MVQQVAGFYQSLISTGGGGHGYSLPGGSSQPAAPQYQSSGGAHMSVDPNAPLGSGWRKLKGDEHV